MREEEGTVNQCHYDMATGKIERLQKIKSKTITGTTDSNAFLATNFLASGVVFLGASELILNGSRYRPFKVTPLFDGGTPAIYISLQFSTYDGSINPFKNANVSVTVLYSEV